MVPGKQPVALGFQAISGDEWIYEMQLKCLLLPGSDGVPTWKSDMPGEAQTIKLPEQFRSFFTDKQQLSEDIGEKLAKWAAGSGAAAAPTADEMIARFVACSDAATLRALEETRAAAWSAIAKADKLRVKEAAAEAAKRVALAAEEADIEENAEDESGDEANEVAA